ncbi:MAG: alpha/beta hydrolase [Bacteroidetes bacterium]|nr:MAG: alpha/beta hydrolase [Bacteroidota bacterium]
MRKQKIYCLSGLGVDQRVFQALELDIYELVHISWIDPLKNESLDIYARRLFEQTQIDDDYLLMGVSFGGMIAVEVAKIKRPRKLILISSMINRHELSLHYRFLLRIGVHNWVPGNFFRNPGRLGAYFFGAKKENERGLLKKIMRDTDPIFLKWALGAISNWRNKADVDLFQIHGTRDKIISCPERIKYEIVGAGHFAVFTHAHMVSESIKKILENENE